MIYSADLLISRVIVMKVSFQIKLFISLVAFFSVLFALLGGYYYVDVGRQLYQEMSARAKIQAEEIALIPSLRKEVEQKDIQGIHDFMQKIAARSDASFIVIGDNKGLHLFHSVFADRVGKTLELSWVGFHVEKLPYESHSCINIDINSKCTSVETQVY